MIIKGKTTKIQKKGIISTKMNIINQEEINRQIIQNKEELAIATSINTKIEKTKIKAKEFYHKRSKKF